LVFLLFNYLLYAFRGLKDDKEIVLEAIKKNGATLRHASYLLRGDEEVILEANNN
jgi:hypothetical protein